ncbi:MAG: DNA repair protein RecO [Firmicutes bacterium]|nr:DNA repair protein RecO [Bacillota bacterium]
MYTETEGIILRQIKTVNGRRMIVLLSKKYGKISAGTSISERGKNKSALALRPFTLGRYEVFKGRESYSINGAETINSFFSIGENIDKFAAASVALELSDRLLEEDQQASGMFNLLSEFLYMLEARSSDFGTLLVGFKLKALVLSGSGIQADACVRCGKTEGLTYLSVQDGGLVCRECIPPGTVLNPLIFEVSDDIINVIRFVQAHPIRSLEKLSIPKEVQTRLSRILKAYYSFHLGIDALKSESLII